MMEWWYYESTRPQRVKGGIKAQSRRGSFGTTWWGRRWIKILEGFSIGARLSRGRSYARSGQVLSIDIEKGGVTARVQGSRSTPYKVSIRISEYKKSDWDEIIKTLRNTPYFAAKLLAGEMPPELEDILATSELSLFPKREADLVTDCSCPDWSNPCKHIAAVYYLLAEEFDRDPFLLFRLRGLNRDELFQRTIGARKKSKKKKSVPEEYRSSPKPITPDEHFWKDGSLPDDFFGPVTMSPVPAALPKRLGNFPFWRAEKPLIETLELSYKNASRYGLETYQQTNID